MRVRSVRSNASILRVAERRQSAMLVNRLGIRTCCSIFRRRPASLAMPVILSTLSLSTSLATDPVHSQPERRVTGRSPAAMASVALTARARNSFLNPTPLSFHEPRTRDFETDWSAFDRPCQSGHGPSVRPSFIVSPWGGRGPAHTSSHSRTAARQRREPRGSGTVDATGFFNPCAIIRSSLSVTRIVGLVSNGVLRSPE